jgi:hypothetical protein
MRQRQNSQEQQDDDTPDDDTALPPDILQTLDNNIKQQQQQHGEALQRQGTLVLQRTSSISSSSGSSFSHGLQRWHSPQVSLTAAAGRAHSWVAAAGSIPEEVLEDYSNNSNNSSSIDGRVNDSAAVANQEWAACTDFLEEGTEGKGGAQLCRALPRLQSRSMLRLESFSASGR